MHDPARVAKREQEWQSQELVIKEAEEKCKPLRKILAVMKTTCEGKGWKVSEQHFDNKSGQYASLEVSRYFNRDGIYDSVIGRLDITFHNDYRLQYSLQGTSFYKYGLDDLRAALEVD